MFGCSQGNGQWQWVLFVLVLQAQHGTKASLARPSQLNNNHASQANSSRHVVNGLGYTSWRPAEACPRRGRITNTSSLELRQLHGKGTGWTVKTEEDRFFLSFRCSVSLGTGWCLEVQDGCVSEEFLSVRLSILQGQTGKSQYPASYKKVLGLDLMPSAKVFLFSWCPI